MIPLELMDRIAEKLSEWFGSAPFILSHVVWFGGWIVAHFVAGLDPDWKMLTLIVSLEAIFLSLFILRAENVAERRNMRVTRRIDKKIKK